MNLGAQYGRKPPAVAVSKEPVAGTAPGLYGRIFGTLLSASQGSEFNVCSGSLADTMSRWRYVRFTPDSGHSSVQVGFPKSANGRQISALRARNSG
jgi:hypothetical protein